MRLWPQRGERVERDVEPLEGTSVSLWNTIIPSWWQDNVNTGLLAYGTPQLAERVWTANRCIQLNSQQIAAMPLKFSGPGTDPEWLSAPDPHWYPNGIGDALFAIVEAIYGWGYCLLEVTSQYADGFPRSWTVIPPPYASVQERDGSRVFKNGSHELDPSLVIQIDRNPGARLHGTPALRAYAQQAWGLLAAGNQAMTVQSGGIPAAVLKSERKITAEQAQTMQEAWMSATASRNGAPAVMGPDISFETLSFNPSDLALIETQEFNARMIATAYGVPAFLLNLAVAGGLTYQNPGMLGELWWRFELRCRAKQIADAFSAQMLPRGQYVWFEASDTFAPLTETAVSSDDPQAAAQKEAVPSQVAPASPTPLRPVSASAGG